MKEGNVLQSKDATTAVSLALIFFTLWIIARYMFQQLQQLVTTGVLAVGHDGMVTQLDILELSRFIAYSFFTIAAPVVAVGFAVPLISSVVQTKGLFTMQPLKPKFSKLNPITGMKKFFSVQTLVEVAKGVVVIGVITAVVFSRILGNYNDYNNLVDMSLRQAFYYGATEVFSLVMLVVMIIVFVAGGDYIFQWWQYEKKLKMSKQEVKDEYKQMEGDPQIKGKIKAKQREVAQMRMMEKVPDADVVVRNPTHYAVAISYNREESLSAPQVTAKGKDALALKIIGIAEEHEVYVTENRQLAKELYDTVEVGDEIPPTLYNAIAVILTDMYTAKGITLDNN